MGPLMINMAFMPLYMWEIWDVTPVTDGHTDGRTVESSAVFSLSWIRKKKILLSKFAEVSFLCIKLFEYWRKKKVWITMSVMEIMRMMRMTTVRTLMMTMLIMMVMMSLGMRGCPGWNDWEPGGSHPPWYWGIPHSHCDRWPWCWNDIDDDADDNDY